MTQVVWEQTANMFYITFNIVIFWLQRQSDKRQYKTELRLKTSRYFLQVGIEKFVKSLKNKGDIFFTHHKWINSFVQDLWAVVVLFVSWFLTSRAVCLYILNVMFFSLLINLADDLLKKKNQLTAWFIKYQQQN